MEYIQKSWYFCMRNRGYSISYLRFNWLLQELCSMFHECIREKPLIKFLIFTSANIKVDIKSQEKLLRVWEGESDVESRGSHKLNTTARYVK